MLASLPTACTVPDPLSSLEEAERYAHLDLPRLPRRALLVERYRAQLGLALLGAPSDIYGRLTQEQAWDWYWQRLEAIAAQLERRGRQ